jgi:hypothetical protein
MLAHYEWGNPVDADENPTGGFVSGTGLFITWQDGPLGRGASRESPNGAFVETVLDAVRRRIQFYQDSRFSCRENALAITKIEEALHWLGHRTQAREQRGVEGTHAV